MDKTTVVIRRGKSTWLVGGHWTAGERFPKRPGRLKKLAADEGFDPSHTSAVWLADEQQVGWFSFDGKPVKGLPLAALAARRLGAGQWPWQGLFKLDEDLWWLVVTDSAGALHPSWDVVGSEDFIHQAMGDKIAELATIPHQERFDDPDAAWEWLMGDAAASRSIPSAVSVASAQIVAKKAVMVTVPLIVVLAASSAGLMWWKHQQALRAQQIAQQSMMAQQQAQSATQAADAAQEAAAMARIEQAWKNTPRPWAQAQTWGDVLSACKVGPITQDGWLLTTVQCSVHGATLNIKRTWARLPFATVLQAPDGDLDPQGQTVLAQSTAPLPAAQPGQPGAEAAQVSRWWLGMTQQWSRILSIKADPLQPFTPPFPPNTPPQIQQKMTPPVLWQQGKVTISSAVEPTPLWPVLSAAGYVPERIEINLRGSRLLWTFEGTQYVNP